MPHLFATFFVPLSCACNLPSELVYIRVSVRDQPTIVIFDAGSKSGDRGWDAALSAVEMVDFPDGLRMDMLCSPGK
jgi:hypothetical protein